MTEPHPYQVDPYEMADALRDAMLTGGADPGEADREAELAIEQAEEWNRTGPEWKLYQVR